MDIYQAIGWGYIAIGCLVSVIRGFDYMYMQEPFLDFALNRALDIFYWPLTLLVDILNRTG